MEMIALIALSAEVAPVIVCDEPSVTWARDNSERILSRLLADHPPVWLEKLIDHGGSRAYAVERVS